MTKGSANHLDRSLGAQLTAPPYNDSGPPGRQLPPALPISAGPRQSSAGAWMGSSLEMSLSQVLASWRREATPSRFISQRASRPVELGNGKLTRRSFVVISSERLLGAARASIVHNLPSNGVAARSALVANAAAAFDRHARAALLEVVSTTASLRPAARMAPGLAARIRLPCWVNRPKHLSTPTRQLERTLSDHREPNGSSRVAERLRNRVQSLLRATAAPFQVLSPSEARTSLSYFIEAGNEQLEPSFLSSRFDIASLLSSRGWIDHDIAQMSRVRQEKCGDATRALGDSFGTKYGDLSVNHDARSVAEDWNEELYRALRYLKPKSLRGRLLHIGADAELEHQPIHELASRIVLADVAENLLRRAALSAVRAKVIRTRVEWLHGIAERSIDLYVALRVYSSYGVNQHAAIKRAARVMAPGGSMLLSISNGYRAADDTVLPGQLVGTPAALCFSSPYEQAISILSCMYAAGFDDLFMVPGSAELFIGGTFRPALTQQLDPQQEIAVHVEDASAIPLCFYSSAMPTAWLGNYSRHAVELDGHRWPTVEHFFQAQKFTDPDMQADLRHAVSPEAAKALAWSRNEAVRPDWKRIRRGIMQRGLEAKFSQHRHLYSALLQTGQRRIVERSHTDLFWGQNVLGRGSNRMGHLLMELRARQAEDA